MKRILIWIVLLIIPVAGWAAEKEENKCECSVDAFPCKLTTISWVEVTFQGELLKKHKGAFEKLIRLRLRNDLSMYSHEVKSFNEVYHEKGIDPRQQEYMKLGEVSCLVWTVGDDYPVAFYVECTLSGWGDYNMSSFDKFESRILGIGSARNVREQVEESIRVLITYISADLLEKRDILKRIEVKREANQCTDFFFKSAFPQL